MTDAPRYLITTADERTWKFDRPVLFLGEWCRLYDRKHVWSKMDAIVAKPYGINQEQRDKNFRFAREIEEQLILILKNELNYVHGTKHDVRYWKIVLGHWLRRYVDVIFNRYHALKQCVCNYKINGISSFFSRKYGLETLNSGDFIYACNDDMWNSVLYGYVFDLLKINKALKIDKVSISEIAGFRISETAKDGYIKRKLALLVHHGIESLTNNLVFKNDAFIINSYLPRVQELRLQLCFGQMPKIWRSPKLDSLPEPNRNLRQEIERRILKNDDEDFFHCVKKFIFKTIPVCYLEGFSLLCKRVKELPWPTSPKFIFTSNNFDTGEIFKIWTALKTETGIPYYAGQHGNNYGTHQYICNTIEEITSDKFLTWGWKDGLKQHIPAFIFKTVSRKTRAYNPYGGLLLIQICLNHKISIWDGYPEFIKYFAEQQNFIEKLNSPCRKTLTVRLHAEYRIHGWSEQARWRDFDPDLNIDDGKQSIRKLIQKSRLVIYSYDSTGILETLSQNIPTLAFWQNGLEHLRETAKPYYQLLIDAGIVHLSPESIAQKVNEVWDDVTAWWDGEEIQKARGQFCDRYAHVSKQPMRDLMKLLTPS